MSTLDSLPRAMIRSGCVVRVGLEIGLIDAAAAIAWADHWIDALPTPPVELAEVSMPGRIVLHELASNIEAVIGRVSPGDEFAIATALFARAIADGRCTVEAAIRYLTGAMHDPDAGVAPGARNELWHLDYNAENEHPLDASGLAVAFCEFAAPYTAAWGDALTLTGL